MLDLLEEPSGGTVSEGPAASAPAVSARPERVLRDGIELHYRDFLIDAASQPEVSIDLIVADPPYGLGKNYGNDSDKLQGAAHLARTRQGLELTIPKLKPSGSLYVFCTWQYAPEIFSFQRHA